MGNYIGLAILALIWGSSFMLISVGLYEFTPYQLASLRITFAGLSLLPLWKHFKAIPTHKYPLLLLFGLCNMFLPSLLFPLAQTHVDSSLSGVMNSFTPIFALVIGLILFKDNPSPQQYLGVALGFVGILTILLSRAQISPETKIQYAFFALGGALCYGVAANMVKHKFKEVSTLSLSAGSYIIYLPLSITLFFLTGGQHSLSTQSHVLQSIMAIALLGIVSSALSLILYATIIRKTSPVAASSVTYLIPIVAILWGTILGEKLYFTDILGLAITLIGVKLATYKRKPKKLSTI